MLFRCFSSITLRLGLLFLFFPQNFTAVGNALLFLLCSATSGGTDTCKSCCDVLLHRRKCCDLRLSWCDALHHGRSCCDHCRSQCEVLHWWRRCCDHGRQGLVQSSSSQALGRCTPPCSYPSNLFRYTACCAADVIKGVVFEEGQPSLNDGLRA